MQITDIKQIETFEIACQVLGLDPEKVLPDFSSYPESDRLAMEAHSKLVIIAKAANQIDNDGKEWQPDWSNYDEYKYYPWFEMAGSSGFQCRVYVYWDAGSGCGSRLCFKERSTATFIGKQFIDTYKLYFTY